MSAIAVIEEKGRGYHRVLTSRLFKLGIRILRNHCAEAILVTEKASSPDEFYLLRVRVCSELIHIDERRECLNA